MLTLTEMKAIAAKVQFKDWTVRVDTGKTNTVPFLQVLFTDTDRISGKTSIQRCRKWQLSYHMVPSEVIRTAFKALRAAVIHEVEEEFRYDGARIYNPHMDLEVLARLVKDKAIPISIRDESNYVPGDK